MLFRMKKLLTNIQPNGRTPPMTMPVNGFTYNLRFGTCLGTESGFTGCFIVYNISAQSKQCNLESSGTVTFETSYKNY